MQAFITKKLRRSYIYNFTHTYTCSKAFAQKKIKKYFVGVDDCRKFALRQKLLDMEYTVFTPAQKHILQMMSYMKDDKQIDELDRILSDYYAKRVDTELDNLVADGIITPEVIEGWGKEHLRTPYK